MGDLPQPTPFQPYVDNGGSVVAVAGEDYAVIGADTRLSTGYTINTREQKKLFKLSEATILGSAGCWCDILTLSSLVQARMKIYQLEHNRPMSTPAVAQMLSTMLYYKRFFPYYALNILAGLDSDGKGCVFSYDPIGHYERTKYRAVGSGGSQLQPLLDNQIGLKNMESLAGEDVPLRKRKAVSLLKDVFIGAAERDIYTGDSIYILTITKNGVKEEVFELRKD